MHYKLLVAILGLALIAGAAGAVRAESRDGDHFGPLVQKIAQRFNLKEADVQAVFDEAKTEHLAEMEVKFDKRLSEAVARSELTLAQKQLILAKRSELKEQFQSRREELTNVTPEEQKEAMKKHHQELKEWAKTNNIPMKYLMPGPKGGRHHGSPGAHSGFHERIAVD